MNLTVRHKLLLNALFAIATTVAVGVAGYVGTARVDRAMDEIVENSRSLRLQMHTDMRHDTLRGDVYAALYEGIQNSTTNRDRNLADIREDGEDMMKSLASALARAPADVRPLMERAREPLERYVSVAGEVGQLAYSDYVGAAERLVAFEAAFKQLEAELEQIGDRIEKRNEASQADGDTAVAVAKSIIWSVCVLAALALVAISFFLARAILRPLDRAVKASTAVAAGDLTVRIASDSKDEFGRLLRALEQMRAELAAAVGEIHAAATNVNTGSREIAKGNADLSARTEEQASSLEETASSMEELTTTVKQNTHNARQANELAIGVSDIASRGGEAVRSVVLTMGGISEASRKIAEITAVIDGIAFQTNILALNAAVEAARAGEQGRGFAVVASEVRALAQRCATAAREIKSLIEESASRVSEGARQVDGAGQTMEQLLESVRRVTHIVAEIAEASDEQLRGIEQVSRAVVQMDQVVQQNAALVEESAAAAENLAGQAELMASTVGRFELDAAHLDREPANQASAPRDAPVARTAPPRLRQASAAAPVPVKAGDEWEEF